MTVDGDTIRASVSIWPDITVDTAIRVLGVDTPELNASALCTPSMPVEECDKLKTAAACERALAVKASAFTDAWIQANAPLIIGAVKPDKFGRRYDAIVTGKSGKSLSADLISAGLGRPYNGGTRLAVWCK